MNHPLSLTLKHNNSLAWFLWVLNAKLFWGVPPAREQHLSVTQIVGNVAGVSRKPSYNERKNVPERLSWTCKATAVPRGFSHPGEMLSWVRLVSSTHSGSVMFLVLKEKRSNSDGEIK